MAIKWAPIISIPMERRLQVFSAFCFIMMVLFGETFCVTIFILAWIYGDTTLRTCCIFYVIFMYIDRKAPENCSRGQGSEMVRNFVVWRYFSKYFPVKLIKSVDLPATKNYLFAVFPHGVISTSAFANFATSTTPFRQMFPGIRSKCCTLNYHFHVPIFRELALSWGMMSAKKISIVTALTQSNAKAAEYNNDGNTSNAVVLMVGGAQEALNARPGNYSLVLKKRKGFVKIALETGTTLVPVYSFGEVELFDQPSNPPGSKLRKFQESCKKLTGVAPACFIGRGFFQYSYGLIPRRKPVVTVIGHPIEVIQNRSPSEQDINNLHEKFCIELEKLFNTHKEKYIKNAEQAKLIIE